jgi:hypothetical protein
VRRRAVGDVVRRRHDQEQVPRRQRAEGVPGAVARVHDAGDLAEEDAAVGIEEQPGLEVAALEADETRPDVLKAVTINPARPRDHYILPEAETATTQALARDGVGWLELSDFVKRMSRVERSPPIMAPVAAPADELLVMLE